MIGASLAIAIPLAVQAQPRHPDYRQAAADVSQAYQLLKHADRGDPPARPEEVKAMVTIEYAYETLKNAAEVDHRNPDHIPAADSTHYDHRGRLHHALDLLHEAHDLVNVDEQNRDTRMLKDRALAQIDTASHDTEEAIRVQNF
jgi:hypothetical protein